MNFRLIWSLSLLFAVRATVIPRAAGPSMTLETRDGNEPETDRQDWYHGHHDHEDDDVENENENDGYQIGEGW
ncbi:hypothetical protein BDV12DRAFT_180144 [Aspergillus spectabilis]